MSEPDYSLMKRLGKNLDTGGSPPDDRNMEQRIAKLEGFSQDTRDRLARIETRMDAFATKTDIGDLRADLHKEITAQTWRLVTFVCGFGTALVAAVYFIAKHTA